MICSDCQHAIQRTFSNGPQFKTVKNYCDIDGQEIGIQIAECSRMEEKVVLPTMEYMLNQDPYAKAEKAWKEEIDPILAVTRPEADYVIKEVAKKKGRRK
ncbi:MAG: hypothetical protein BWY21_02063 [Parcubacteria group bacterium ADurb.Bin216]|nr:MAG: hypothetical protein BWY21_02063 [Parcubacteria group bacterium ADurb.Bin216]